jgi:hypothetical protein
MRRAKFLGFLLSVTLLVALAACQAKTNPTTTSALKYTGPFKWTMTPTETPSTPVATNTMTSSPTATATLICGSMGTIFLHPGAWSSCTELNFVKTQIAANAQPWTNRLNQVKYSGEGTQSAAHFSGTVFDSCSIESQGQADSEAAYAQALVWYLTGDATYGNRAVSILNAWAGLQSITASGSCYNQQNILDAAWFGADFANAAELMRFYSGWAPVSITTFQNMLKTAFYPLLATASTGNGNIDMTEIDAMMSMAVFCDDPSEFNLGLQRLQARVPAYIYTSSSPSLIPRIAGDACCGTWPNAFWSNPVTWVTGLEQETCRDNGHHAQFGLNSGIHAAEVSWHQGTDVYTTYQSAFVPALELLSLQLTSGSMQGTCTNNTADPIASDLFDTFEVGYNHYAIRKGVSMPNTQALILNHVRCCSNNWILFNLAYETLTHAEVN